MLRRFGSILFPLFFGILLVPAEKAQAAERVVVRMGNGDKLEGELLRRSDGHVWLLVGGEVISLPARRIKAIEGGRKDGRSGPDGLKSHGLYTTARLPARDMQSLVDELGPAIVVVKTPSGLGTGWFVHQDGYVVTNHHVVAGERSIRVTMFPKEGKTLGHKLFRKVRIVALNAEMDLALLKIEEKIGVVVPQLVLGDSQKVKAGDRVFAIGNPLGLERSTSQGIISKVARNIGGRLFIQTTAPIAPGNSGGPLFNHRGEVVGVVSRGAILLDGLGFAIPSAYVKEFLDHIESFSYDSDNPNTGVQYMEVPVQSSDRRFRFDRSDFFKVGHGLSDLVLGDLDSDGVEEIVFANNNKSEICILRHRPVQAGQARKADELDVNDLPRSERFILESLPVASRIDTMTLGDLDGDGRKDILFYGSMDGLAVMRQNKDGSFAQAEKLDELPVSGLPGAIQVADMDSDGKPDLFVLGLDRFSIFFEGSRRRDYPLNPSLVSKVKSFELVDHDGDRRLDVLFFTQNSRFGAYLRRQGDDRRFDEDWPLRVSVNGPVRVLNRGETRSFAALDLGKNRVRNLSLASGKGKRSLWVSLPIGLGNKGSLDVDVLDIDGDGVVEILGVDEMKHEYVLFDHGEQGFASTRSPAPEAVTAVRMFRDSDKRQAVFTFSRKEQLFGANRVDQGRIGFPRPIHTQGPVQLMQLERLRGLDGDQDEKAVLLWVEKRSGGFSVQLADAEAAVGAMAKSPDGAFRVSSRSLNFVQAGVSRAELAKRPVRLAFADFNGDAKLDLIVFWAYSGKESLFLGQGKGSFVEVLSEQGIISREGDKAGLLVADLDGDGRADVLQVQPGFIRVLRVDGSGKLFVASQHNWRHGSLKHFESMGGRRFVAVEGQQAYVVRLDVKSKQFVVTERLDLGGLDLERMLVGDVDGDGEPDMLGVGQGHIALRIQGQLWPQVAERTLVNANLSHHVFFKLHTADLDRDGQDELLLFDNRRAIMEIRRASAAGDYRPVLRHPLFDKHFAKQAKMGKPKAGVQPQAIEVGDVDGDGKPDLIFLLHDRVAIFLQARK